MGYLQTTRRWTTVSRFFFASKRRITGLVSDWSSDVCSSDLDHGQLAAEREEIATRDTPRLEVFDEGLEIGRASCRERGVDLGGRRIIKKKEGTEAGWAGFPAASAAPRPQTSASRPG